jgi:DNA-binding transcriptional MerR regulator
MDKQPQQLAIDIELPDKKYFTIGEVSEICQLKSHVLRYWEQAFPQLKPSKRRGRRYYQKSDLLLLLEIKSLLHDQGFTIPGAKARLDQVHSAHYVLSEQRLEAPQQDMLSRLTQLHQDVVEFKHYIQQTY